MGCLEGLDFVQEKIWCQTQQSKPRNTPKNPVEDALEAFVGVGQVVWVVGSCWGLVLWKGTEWLHVTVDVLALALGWVVRESLFHYCGAIQQAASTYRQRRGPWGTAAQRLQAVALVGSSLSCSWLGTLGGTVRLGRIGSRYGAGMGKFHKGTMWDNSGNILSQQKTKKTISTSNYWCCG